MTFAPDFASAQNTPYPFTPTEPAAIVQNCQPTAFEIECGAPSGSVRPWPRDTSCLDDQLRIDFELFLETASGKFQQTGFRSPDGLGPVIPSYEFPDFNIVRVYSDPTSRALAYVRYKSWPTAWDWCDPQAHRIMAVVPPVISTYRQRYIYAGEFN
jgi:hypothetical protein